MKKRRTSLGIRILTTAAAVLLAAGLLTAGFSGADGQAHARDTVTVNIASVQANWTGLESGASVPTADVEIVDDTTRTTVWRTTTSGTLDMPVRKMVQSWDFSHDYSVHVTNVPQGWKLQFQDSATSSKLVIASSLRDLDGYEDPGVAGYVNADTLAFTLTFCREDADASKIPVSVDLSFLPALSDDPEPIRNTTSLTIRDRNDPDFAYTIPVSYYANEEQPQHLTGEAADFPDRSTDAYTPDYYIDTAAFPDHHITSQSAERQADGSWNIGASLSPGRSAEVRVILHFIDLDEDVYEDPGFSKATLHVADPETGFSQDVALTKNNFDNSFQGVIELSDAKAAKRMTYSVSTTTEDDPDRLVERYAPAAFYGLYEDHYTNSYTLDLNATRSKESGLTVRDYFVGKTFLSSNRYFEYIDPASIKVTLNVYDLTEDTSE